jgi:hypothetical protein
MSFFFAVTWACATVAVTAGYSVSRYNARRWAVALATLIVGGAAVFGAWIVSLLQ